MAEGLTMADNALLHGLFGAVPVHGRARPDIAAAWLAGMFFGWLEHTAPEGISDDMIELVDAMGEPRFPRVRWERYADPLGFDDDEDEEDEDDGQ